MSARQNPYVGLVPYTEADAEWFFGRDQEVRLITANLRAARLTLLYGASGVGKSSVLLAGVLPRLQHLVVEHRPVAAGNGRGTLLADRPPIAVTVFREWRDPPLAQLADGMRSAVAEACDDDVPPWDGAEPFTDWLRTLTARARTLLVVLDQFEEYFQYHPDETGPGTFGTQFPAIVNDPDLRVHFLMSLREDAWSRLDRFKGEIPELFGNYLRIDYLDRAAAHDAIVKPLEHYNETAAEPVGIEPELLDAILRDVRTGRLALAEGQPTGPGTEPAPEGEERVETPYLQLVMERLWAAGTANGGHALTLATLEELGGAASIVSSHLTDAMAALSADDRATAADVFGFLVTPSKTKIAHRASDLAYWAQRPEAEVRRVLDDLASGDRRILRRVPPPGDEEVDRYEIFHDVLADAILEWAGENRQQRQRAEAREARRRARRRNALRILGGVALVAAVVVAFLMWNHQRKHSADVATQAQIQNEKNRIKEAEQRSGVLARSSETQLGSDSERALLLALAAYRASHTDEAGRALGRAFAAARARAAYVERPSPGCATCATRARARPAPVAFSGTGPYFYGPFEPEGMNAGEQASLSPDGSMVALIRDGRVELWRPAEGKVDTVRGARGVAKVAFIGNGSRLLVLTRNGRALVAGGAGTARPLGDRPELLAVSADGRYVATTSGRALRVWPLAHPGAATSAKLGFFPGRLTFSPADPGVIAVMTYEGAPALVRWRSTARVPKPRGPFRPVPAAPAAAPSVEDSCFGAGPAMFSADGRVLISTGPDGRVIGLSMPELKKRFRLPPTVGCPSVVRVDAHARRVLVASGSVATIYSGRGGIPVAQLGGHTDSIADAAFSPNGDLVATAGADGSARVWDAETGVQLVDLRGTGLGGRVAPIAHVSFTPDGRFVVTADEDGVARMWVVTSGTRHLGAWRRRVRGVGLADDGRVLASLPGGAIVSLAPGGGRRQVVRKTPGHTGYTLFSADGTHAASFTFGKGNGSLLWFELGRRKLVRLASAEFVNSISISEDGRDVLVGGNRRLRVWSDGRASGVVRLTRDERRDGNIAELSKDGRRVLIARFLGGARLVNVDGTDEARLRGEAAKSLNTADFSPDGTQVVTAGQRGAVVWDAKTGRPIDRLGASVGPVTGAVFSRPDGLEITTVDRHGTIRIFDAEKREEKSALAPHPGARYGLLFNSATRTAVVVGEDGLAVRRCDACRSFEWLEAHAGARLTLTPAQVEDFIRKEAR
jgi:WD40 repeat protein